MSDHFGHPRDDLQLLADERLPAERRGVVQAHVADCLQCRREIEALRRLKSALREQLPRHDVPPEVSERIRAALGAEAAAGADSPRRSFELSRRVFLIGGAAAAAAVVALLFARRRDRDPVRAAAEDLTRFRSDQLELELRTDDVAALERFFAARALGFPARVFDLGMMGYALVGGSVHRLAGARSALFAYQGAQGGRLICQMYEGTTGALPPAEEERVANQIPFRVYRREGLTLVFWQEGPVVCVLASDGDSGEAVDLALAKASA